MGKVSEIGGERYLKAIRKIQKDKEVKAVVLRVNSGGGSAFASDVIWHEIEELQSKNIPVVVSMGDYAASGGYYIACGSDRIFAEPTTITGSIGVFGITLDMQKFYNNKLGITYDGVKTAPFADIPTSVFLSRSINDEEKSIVQGFVEDIYDDFLEKVAEGRSKTVEQIHEIAQGRVWSGVKALEIGLVDELGGLEDAIAEAAKMAEVNSYELDSYPKIEFNISELLKEKFPLPFAKAELPAPIVQFLGGQEIIDLIMGLETMNPIQARMPFDINME
ncbi:UNVERIFIED_CONTAM: hypothetical protein GTU68_009398 [Idotea baltica]|nr:hypothetical protein [Idotea baltica]